MGLKRKRNIVQLLFYFNKTQIIPMFTFIITLLDQTFLASAAATGDVLWKKMLLKISKNSHENTCVRVSFLKKLQLHSGTGVFLRILQKILRSLYLLNNSGSCF